MTNRIISLLLIAILCIGVFAGCAKDNDTPKGMYSATLEGEPFTLFVPDGWTDNRDSGISSAYLGLNVIASARYYTPENPDETLATFVSDVIEQNKKKYEDFSFVRKDALLGKDTPAIRLEYDFDHQKEATEDSVSKAKAVQYYAQNGESIVMLSFYCESSAFDDYAEVFEQIRKEFRLGEKSPADDVVTDKKTPEGMKLASEKGTEYRFYIPNTWKTTIGDGAAVAIYPESGNPNVSVSSYSLSGEMSATEYFELAEEEYKKSINGYERISTSERKIHDRKAVSYTYKAAYDETELRIMQTIFIYNEFAYSITYTAHADRFEAHMDDVNAMLDAFRFR